MIGARHGMRAEGVVKQTEMLSGISDAMEDDSIRPRWNPLFTPFLLRGVAGIELIHLYCQAHKQPPHQCTLEYSVTM